MHNYGKEKTVTEPESCGFINNFFRQRAETELLCKKQGHLCKLGVTSMLPELGRQRQEDNYKFRVV